MVVIDGTTGVDLGHTPISNGTNVEVEGNLNISGVGSRITGDFSNATLGNRALIQTSTANSNTALSAIPNGTATSAYITSHNSSDTVNYGAISLRTGSTECGLSAINTGTATALPMTFYVGGSNRVFIDTNGNVGINNSAPLNKLHVGGYIIASDTNYASVGSFIGAILNNNNATPSLDIRRWNGVATNHGVVKLSGDSAGNMMFSTDVKSTNTEANTERMRIDVNGNIGIGTSSPEKQLSLNGSSGIALMNTGVTGRRWNIANDGNFNIGSYTTDPNVVTNRLSIDGNGTIGIGATPNAWNSSFKAVELNGHTALWSSTGTPASYLSTNAVFNQAGNYVYAKSSYLATIYEQVNGNHIFGVAPSGTAGNTIAWTIAMTLKPTGNLLVGTSNDNGADKLQVSGSISSGAIRAMSSGDLNDYKFLTQTIGIYPAMSNVPIYDYGYLEVIIYGSANWLMQRFTCLGATNISYAGRTFVRCFTNGTTWTAWVEK